MAGSLKQYDELPQLVHRLGTPYDDDGSATACAYDLSPLYCRSIPGVDGDLSRISRISQVSRVRYKSRGSDECGLALRPRCLISVALVVLSVIGEVVIKCTFFVVFWTLSFKSRISCTRFTNEDVWDAPKLSSLATGRSNNSLNVFGACIAKWTLIWGFAPARQMATWSSSLRPRDLDLLLTELTNSK